MTATPMNGLQPSAAGGSGAPLPNLPRPSPPTALSAALTFGWRALLKIRHVPEQLADVVGIPILFTLLFTYLFGGALAASTHAYLQLLLPGTLVMTLILVSVYTGIGLNTDISKGTFDRFRSMPIWRPAALVGALLGDGARNTLAATIVIGLGLAMGFRPAGGPTGVIAAVALLLAFSFSLAWIWTTLALLVRTPSAVSNVSLLVTFPLTFASNIFVRPQTMPGWLRSFVDLNPISHLVTAERGLMAGTATVGQVGWGAARLGGTNRGLRAADRSPLSKQGIEMMNRATESTAHAQLDACPNRRLRP